MSGYTSTGRQTIENLRLIGPGAQFAHLTSAPAARLRSCGPNSQSLELFGGRCPTWDTWADQRSGRQDLRLPARPSMYCHSTAVDAIHHVLFPDSNYNPSVNALAALCALPLTYLIDCRFRVNPPRIKAWASLFMTQIQFRAKLYGHLCDLRLRPSLYASSPCLVQDSAGAAQSHLSQSHSKPPMPC
jgi:hypothetical protein